MKTWNICLFFFFEVAKIYVQCILIQIFQTLMRVWVQDVIHLPMSLLLSSTTVTCAHFPYISTTAYTLFGIPVTAGPWSTPLTKKCNAPAAVLSTPTRSLSESWSKSRPYSSMMACPSLRMELPDITHVPSRKPVALVGKLRLLGSKVDTPISMEPLHEFTWKRIKDL